MSMSPRALQELMTAVDAGRPIDGNVDSASSGSSKLLLGPRRRPTYNGRGSGGARKGAPAVEVAVVEASSTDATSFEFSAVVSYNSASPASMVFSDGQLRAHQFPAKRSGAGAAGSSQLATSPVRISSSIGSYSTTKQQAGVTAGGNKRVSFATEGAGNAGGGQGKKRGGLLGCCGPSSRNEAVEPVARNDINRKVVAF